MAAATVLIRWRSTTIPSSLPGTSRFASFLASRSALAASRSSRASIAAFDSPPVHSTGADGKQTVQRIEPYASTASASLRPDSSGSQAKTVSNRQVEQLVVEWM